MSPRDLYNACFNGDWSQAGQLLDGGVSAEFTHPESGANTLYVAVARKAPPELLARLLKDGRARPDVGDSKGFTPLHAACQYGASIETVLLLLGAGAHVNQAASDGATALHFAAQYRVAPSVLKALIHAEGDVNATKKNGASPLFCAVENGADAAFVRILLKAGSDPQFTIRATNSMNRVTPLSVARRTCTADVIAILEEREAQPGRGRPPIKENTWEDSKVEKARLLFRDVVTASSTLSVTQSQFAGEDTPDILVVRQGERVTLVMGSLEEGLHEPYDKYALVSSHDGSIGMVMRGYLRDPANIEL